MINGVIVVGSFKSWKTGGPACSIAFLDGILTLYFSSLLFIYSFKTVKSSKQANKMYIMHFKYIAQLKLGDYDKVDHDNIYN